MRINNLQANPPGTDPVQTHRPGGLTLTRAALAQVPLAPKDAVLDAGCGLGATCTLLAQAPGIKVFGMDASWQRITRAAAGQPSQDSPCTWTGLQGRLPRLPFASGTFKAVFCECVLSLVPDKQDSLDEFFRVLQPGGRLVLTDLYLPVDTPAGPTQSPLTCLDGAMGKTALTCALALAGFSLRVWEDHTQLLKQMACEMVFKHGSLDEFWKTITADVMGTGLGCACRAGNIKPGYCLIIAEKPYNKTDGPT